MGNEIPKLQLHTQFDFEYIKSNLTTKLNEIFDQFLHPLLSKPTQISNKLLNKKQIKIVKLLTEKCFDHVLEQVKVNCQVQGVDFNKAVNDNNLELESLDHDLLAEVQELMDENDELTLEVTRLRHQYPQAYSKLFNNQSLSTLNLFGFNLAGEGALLEDFDNTYSDFGEVKEISEQELDVITKIFDKLNPLTNELKELVTKSEQIQKVVNSEYLKRNPKSSRNPKRIRRFEELEKASYSDVIDNNNNNTEIGSVDELMFDEVKLKKVKLFRVNFGEVANAPTSD